MTSETYFEYRVVSRPKDDPEAPWAGQATSSRRGYTEGSLPRLERYCVQMTLDTDREYRIQSRQVHVETGPWGLPALGGAVPA